MPRVPSFVAAIVFFAVHLTGKDTAYAQTADQINACAARKTEASGHYMDAIIDCQTRLGGAGDGSDAKCVMQAARKMTQAFAGIERDGACATANDAPTVIARINASVTDLVAMLDPANSTQCRKQQLMTMGKEAERQARCVADAVALGAGQSIDADCQVGASERFFVEFERVNGCSVTSDAAAIDAAIRTASSLARNVIKPPVSSCAPIEVTALHGSNFQGSSRLSKIENGRVACIHSDDASLASCAFSIAPGRQSGEWLESPQGNFALVGQALRLDGTPGGQYIAAAAVSDAAPAACVEPVGMDTMGAISGGAELVAICMVEELLAPYNASSAYGFFPLENYAGLEVCSTDRQHPDQPFFLRSYASSGTGPDDRFCYTGPGAALNDINGHERDGAGMYFNDEGHCHFLQVSGYEVPAAKRPATFSYPAPGGINSNSAIVWRPVSPNFVIANGGGSTPVLTFEDKTNFLIATLSASATGPLPDLGTVGSSVTIGSITFSLAVGGNTLSVGASGTGAEPDWYPPLPGNDIALGYESLQLQMATPVFSVGFDFVEPNSTMPSFGGTPVDSTFDVVLYLGSNEVGRTSFNLQDDVVGFFGVWSHRAFDRVTIIDRTGNHDDEFFGAFYTGTKPRP